MENNFGAWFHQADLQPPDLNISTSPLNLMQPNTHPAPMRASLDTFPMGGILPGSYGIPNFRGYRNPNPPQGWFYGLPRYRQNFNFLPNPTLKKEVPVGPCENPNQKRFIVFDQSGGQTTAIYSSGIRAPVPCLTSLCPKIGIVHDTNEKELETRRDTIQYATKESSDGNPRDDSGTEMHEDTDEINALLYSSDEDGYSEDEEVSTGHSPCVINANDKRKLFEEIGEVASSLRCSKRMKLENEGYGDTASSYNPLKRLDYEDDAESSCGDGKNDLVSRKEKIRETVGVLQKILPVGKNKDVIMILDEAIGYLKSLKHKALDLGVEIL